MKKILWQYFPKNMTIPDHLENVVFIFDQNYDKINSEEFELNSNTVLSILLKDLEANGYIVEKGKKKLEKIKIPVLFGLNGILEKSFDADAYNNDLKTVIEIEAGRAVTNYQFLKDLFQACMMKEVDYLSIAVRTLYRGNKDFQIVRTFIETLYASDRMNLPLKGILIIGY